MKLSCVIVAASILYASSPPAAPIESDNGGGPSKAEKEVGHEYAREKSSGHEGNQGGGKEKSIGDKIADNVKSAVDTVKTAASDSAMENAKAVAHTVDGSGTEEEKTKTAEIVRDLMTEKPGTISTGKINVGEGKTIEGKRKADGTVEVHFEWHINDKLKEETINVKPTPTPAPAPPAKGSAGEPRGHMGGGPGHGGV